MSDEARQFSVGCSFIIALCVVCVALMTAVSVFVLRLMGVV